MNIVAYKFWSPTCGPCKVIGPALEDLKEEFQDVEWRSVNIQQDFDSLAIKFNVKFVPTMVVLRYDSHGVLLFQESHTGTSISGYYRILKNAQRIMSLN
jgi:thiol-disulfide isomerase/thioredoxin